jgi:hypothetical protein
LQINLIEQAKNAAPFLYSSCSPYFNQITTDEELPSHTQESSPFVSYYSVLMAKSCFIPLLKVAIMLRS